ncbi:Potassium-transporting ATPase A chain (Potassium-translocating ATPase A chain) (ATP phosphohydrolase (potassium-transporting) A chain) (Potassium binding and translocating subunit A) [Xenorhabdus nematophila F1]|uniref:Potassium-transporting ATPase A chain (Potassium-translocating ATPase A chain) (ATP phosphohydrolase [potassium-transporting] A chain) (Potassium binding and translocating subunit A) n=1 Tax=Xenorhabdus nematophila (strain ATCC 19061 / DSM 3370 / CCUG 14189 / LMG 1036 / NCIMB 9965 / AN6) TaxID=406817 RepID=D3VEX7_XENNA
MIKNLRHLIYYYPLYIIWVLFSTVSVYIENNKP